MAKFENGHGKVLSSASIGPVTPAQRGDESALLHRSAHGKVPRGTRRVVVMLSLTRRDASDDDGLADNLSLVFTR